MKKVMSKCSVLTWAVFLAGCAFIAPVPVSKPDDYLEGMLDGEADAQGDPMWAIAGLGCGPLGLIGAYALTPSPKITDMQGRSPEYIMGYRRGYQKRAREINMWGAAAGWGMWILMYALYTSSSWTARGL